MQFFLQQYQKVILTLLQMATNPYINLKFSVERIGIDIFYPTGKPILLHRLRCYPFAVYKYSFTGHCLAAEAISARE